MLKLKDLNKPAPRYTSYPTAPSWENLTPSQYEEELKKSPSELSLYVHIPFCASMCLFCGCSVILNRKVENEIAYVKALCTEIDLVAKTLQNKKKLSQLHFGGGTPTKLSIELLQTLFEKITSCFEVDFSGEIAIEIDPRTASFAKLMALKEMGFNRVSFGVQDVNEKVQEAIRRRQSETVTKEVYYLAKSLGFLEINIDLIYGLPFQTRESFKKTIEAILELRPDRIALFSYAKIPSLKAHQKAIPESTLPLLEEKFAIYEYARKALVENGYLAIGMDHFSLKESELAKSYLQKRLHRNFQGYTVKASETLIGLGVTSIGYTQNGYFQNVKELASYYEALKSHNLPVFRGKLLTSDDKMRKWTIEKLMCTFEVNKEEFFQKFGRGFDDYFADIDYSEVNDFIVNTAKKFCVTGEGELFIRNIASCFDAYLKHQTKNFSQTV